MDLSWVVSIWLPLVALAAFRLTKLWISDMVPPLPRLRRWLRERAENSWSERTNVYSSINGVPTGLTDEQMNRNAGRSMDYGSTPPATYLLDCYWCAGFWITAATVTGVTFLPLWLWAIPVLLLALSAVIGLLGHLTD